MAFYFSIAALFFLFGFSSYGRNCRMLANPICFWMLALFLFLLAGFRYGIETDYWSYKRIFTSGDTNGIEPGFSALIHFCKASISEDFNVFVFLIALLSVLSKCSFFSKLKNPHFALFLYFCLLYIMAEWNVLRQGFAISFLFFSLHAAKKRKFILFVFFLALAVSMHISSLLFIPMYFMYDRTISVKKILMLIFAFYIFRVFVFDIVILRVLSFLSSRVENLFLQRLYIYMNEEKAAFVTVGLIRRFVFLFCFLLLNKKSAVSDVYFNAYLVGFFIYLFFMGNTVLSSRMSMSFEAMMIPMFANLTVKQTWRSMHCLLLVCAIAMALFGYSLSGGKAVPYTSYLLYVKD